MRVCVCRGSAACRGASCPCGCHGGHVALRVRASDLGEGYYVVHLEHGAGPTLCALEPVTYSPDRTPLHFSRGALLAWLADASGVLVVERVL